MWSLCRRYGWPVPDVEDLVAAHILRWETASVEVGVFGSAEPAVVAGHLRAFVERALGAVIVDGLFYGSSSGCVLGVALGNGRQVVVKAYQRQWGADFLAAVRRIQEHLCGSGFPCPRPLLGPQPAGSALATVEELMADPGMRVLGTQAEMEHSAGGLARQIGLCRGHSERILADSHPLRAPHSGLYPQPHNPIFDFSLDAAGAAWIDELAEAAKVARDADRSALVVAHTDWSARNVRIDHTGVSVVYDWDSLSLVTESVAVGQAAATWRSTGEPSDPIAPSPDEIKRYLNAYTAAREEPFTTEQTRAVLAAALWVLAYTARCEHALEAATGRKLERARARLATHGHAYIPS